MTKLSIYNADSNECQSAIHIIEDIIEPLLVLRGDDTGLENKEYYETEQKIIDIIDKYN